MAVIDGLLSEQERGELLDWLTAPGGQRIGHQMHERKTRALGARGAGSFANNASKSGLR